MLIFGVIHGDEQAGLQIVALLTQLPVPAGVDLYLVDSMNPDGVAADMRKRQRCRPQPQLPVQLGPIAQPGDWEYAGPAAASEPETRAAVDLISTLRPIS